MTGSSDMPFYDYVLFDTDSENYTITRSVIHQVHRIEIVETQVLPVSEKN